MFHLLALLLACPPASDAEARPPGPYLDEPIAVVPAFGEYTEPEWNGQLVEPPPPIPTEEPRATIAPLPPSTTPTAPAQGAKAETDAALAHVAAAEGPASHHK